MKREIDIHGMSVSEARKNLKSFLSTLPKGVTEVEVIHGYNQGNALQQYIRKEFSHKRIERKILSGNNGITIFLIK